LIFASGDRLHLAFKVVEESNLGRVCLPAVAVVDMDRDIIDTVNDFIASSQARGIRVYIMRDKRQDEVFNDPFRLEMK
jgi:hypothetical protein